MTYYLKEFIVTDEARELIEGYKRDALNQKNKLETLLKN